MSQTHAHPEKPAKHTHAGDELPEPQVDSVPAPEHSGHAHSHAAHLEEAGPIHTKPEGNLRQGSAPGALREPPQEVGRVGKQHRRQ